MGPTAAASGSRDSPRRATPWGFAAAVVAVLVALAALLAWQTSAGLGHIDRMMAERSRTLYRMVAIEVRNVARYGTARLERLDEVLAELAAGADVDGVVLARTDGAVRLAHGELPDPLPPYPADGRSYVLAGSTLLLAGPVRIETHGCPACASCGPADGGCPRAAGEGIAGAYEVLLALDAGPYLELRRSVWMQAGAGAALVLALAVGLRLYQLQTRRAAAMRGALAVAGERARSLERLGRMAAGLAHEIKNPVGALRGFAQLIAERASPGSPEAEYAALMVAELDAINRRVDRLRDWARPAPPDLRSARPTDVIRRVTALLEPDLRARALRLALDLPPDPGPEAPLDVDRFRDVVVNLVMNAIEASPAGGRVGVRLDVGAAGEMALEVTDEGPGIPDAERERVLRPFHSTKSGGMGLGLSVAQQGIEDHGGRLEIGAAPGAGALLRAVWPGRTPGG